VTWGYDLAEYIVHAVTSPIDNSRGQNVRAATTAALKQADELGCADIAIPVLGTGHGGLSFQAGVKIIGETIDGFQANRISVGQLVCHRQDRYERAQALCSQSEMPWVERTY
jgi:O-acetyl-ADP-ribose deacetylase (regulator of RNase III)